MDMKVCLILVLLFTENYCQKDASTTLGLHANDNVSKIQEWIHLLLEIRMSPEICFLQVPWNSILVLKYFRKYISRVNLSATGNPNSTAKMFSTSSMEFNFPQNLWKLYFPSTQTLFSMKFVEIFFILDQFLDIIFSTTFHGVQFST